MAVNILYANTATSSHTIGAEADVPGMVATSVSVAGPSSVILFFADFGLAHNSTDSAADFGIAQGGTRLTNGPVVQAWTDNTTGEESGDASLRYAITGLSTGTYTFSVRAASVVGSPAIATDRDRSFCVVEITAGASILVDTHSVASQSLTGSWANLTALSDTQTPSTGVLLFLGNVQQSSAATCGDFRFAVDGALVGPVVSAGGNSSGANEYPGVGFAYADDGITLASHTFALQGLNRAGTHVLSTARRRTFQVVELPAGTTIPYNNDADVSARTATSSPTWTPATNNAATEVTGLSVSDVCLVLANAVMDHGGGTDTTSGWRLRRDGTTVVGSTTQAFSDTTSVVNASTQAWAEDGLSGDHYWQHEFTAIQAAVTTDTGRERSLQVLVIPNEGISSITASEHDMDAASVNVAGQGFDATGNEVYVSLDGVSIDRAVSDSFSETNQDATAALGNGTVTGKAQTFTATHGELERATFYLSKTLSPTGNAVAKLYATSGNLPTGAALATSGNLDVSTLTGTLTLVNLSFTDQFEMVVGTTYAIVLEYSGGDASNYVNVGVDATAPADDGQGSQNTGTWATVTADHCFYVYVASVDISSAINTESATLINLDYTSLSATELDALQRLGPGTRFLIVKTATAEYPKSFTLHRPQAFVYAASANIAASGEATTAQLTAPTPKTTADFDAGRIQDDENPSDAIVIGSDEYTEVEDSIKATAAARAKKYLIRWTDEGTPFDTYTNIPGVTITAGAQGVATPEIQPFAVAAVAEQPQEGTGSPSLGSVTASGAGAQPFEGIGAPALQAATAVGASIQEQIGAAAPVLESAAATAAGLQIQPGAGTPELAAAALAAQGEQPSTASGSPGLQEAVLQAASLEVLIATAAPALAILEADAIGNHGTAPVGAGTPDLAQVDAAASGVQTQVGAGTPQLETAIAGAQGEQPFQGVGHGPELEQLEVAAAAIQEIVGITCSPVLEALLAQGAGNQGSGPTGVTFEISRILGTISTSSNSVWSEAASITLTEDGTYLVLCSYGFSVEDVTNKGEVRLQQDNTTEIRYLLYESQSASAGAYTGPFWMTQVTRSGTDIQLDLDFKAFEGTPTCVMVNRVLLAIRLDDLGTEDTDWRYQEVSGETSNMDTVFTNNILLTETWTPPSSEDWLIIAACELRSNVTNASAQARLSLNDEASIYDTISVEAEDAAEWLWWGSMRVLTLPASSQKVEIQARSSSGAVADARRKSFFAIRAGAVDQLSEARADSYATLSAQDVWEEKVNAAYTPNQSEDVLILGHCGVDFPTLSVEASTRVHEAETDDLMFVRFQANDTTDLMATMYADIRPITGTYNADLDLQVYQSGGLSITFGDAAVAFMSLHVGAAGPPAGTAQPTLQGTTVAALAEQPQDAVAAPVLNSALLNAQGAAGFAAAAMPQIENATLAANAGEIFTGSGTPVLVEASLAASGLLQPSATGTPLLETAIVAGTGAAGEPEGAGNPLLEAHSVIASALVAPAGSGAPVLADAVISAAALQLLAGSGAPALQDAMVAANGLLVPTGTGTLSIAEALLIAIGATGEPQGDGTPTIESQSIAASALMVPAGAGIPLLTGATVSAAAIEILAGAGTPVLQLANLAAAGTQPFAAIGSPLLGAVTLDAIAAEILIGIGSPALDQMVVDAAAIIGGSGSSGAPLIEPAQITAAGLGPAQGIASPLLSGAILAASGEQPFAASATVQIQNAVIAATAEQQFLGVGTLSLGTLNLDAVALMAFPAIGTLVLQSLRTDTTAEIRLPGAAILQLAQLIVTAAQVPDFVIGVVDVYGSGSRSVNYGSTARGRSFGDPGRGTDFGDGRS